MLIPYLLAAACLQPPRGIAALRAPRVLGIVPEGTLPARARRRLPRRDVLLSAARQQRRDELLSAARAQAIAKGAVKNPRVVNLMMRESLLWWEALREASLNSSNVSEFGRSVGKVPASWVAKIQQMSKAKTFRYNFQGSIFSKDVKKWRGWVRNFTRDQFGPADYLRYTDAPDEYEALGSFDRTRTGGGFRPKSHLKNSTLFKSMSDEYYELMAASNFTLCPRGDRAFSYRFYEAALTRSIPIVSSFDFDLAPRVLCGIKRFVPQGLRCIGYHYYSLNESEPLVYREDWAEENYRLFIRYQTFLEGDNVPPNCLGIHFFNATNTSNQSVT